MRLSLAPSKPAYTRPEGEHIVQMDHLWCRLGVANFGEHPFHALG